MEYKIFANVDVSEEDLEKAMEHGTFSQVKEFLDGCIKAQFVEYLPYEITGDCLAENNRLDKEIDDLREEKRLQEEEIFRLKSTLCDANKQIIALSHKLMQIQEEIPDIKPLPEQDLSRQRELTRQAYENGFEEGLADFPHRNTMSIDFRASCQEVLDECGSDVNENDLIQFIRYFTTHAVAIFESDDGERIEMRPHSSQIPNS